METTYQIRCSLCFFFASPYLLDIHHPYASVCLRCRVPLKEILCISALLQLIQCDRCFSLFFKKPIATFFFKFYSVVAIRKGTSQHGPIGVSAPNRKKKQLKEKVKNECQKQETGPRKKRGMNEFEMDKKKGEAFRLEHAGLFGGKFDWNQQQCCLYYTTIDVCRRPIISQYTKYIQLFFC